MLIIPAAAARLWTERFGRVVVLAGALGAVSGYAGASASALLPRLPAGAVIVLASAGIFGVSLLVSPRRGILATAVRRAALRVAIMRDHALRAMWELLETDGESVAISDLAAARRWPRWKAALAARWMVARGLAVRGRTGDAGARAGVSLTPAGRLAARDVVLRHRAFERFLVDEVRLDPTHVDASADLVEHAIDPAMLAELARTRAEDAGTPRSVHPIERPRR
jgi:manganese/zinc/iron transport system permease protein